MRKQLGKLIWIVCLLVLSCSGVLSGSAYDQYYNGDTNYEFACIQMGTPYYVDKNSIQSQLYQPPNYRLSAIVYAYISKTGMLSYPSVVTFEYNYDTKEVYSCDQNGRRYTNKPLRTDYYASQADMRAMAKAKVIWRTAYNMEW